MEAALQDAKKRFTDTNKKSQEIHIASADVLPGSNTRATLYHAPFPIRIKSGSGCKLVSEDNQEFVDYLGEFTAGLFGHSDKTILNEIRATMDDGINLGAHTKYEYELAKLITARTPSIDQVRFTNSGTEANMYNVALAKAYTMRSKVMVFFGAYHGGTLSFGSTDLRINLPHDWIIGTYNDIDDTKKKIQEAGSDLAAVLVEPMQGSTGCIVGKPEFLHSIREETNKVGTLLILDEVMTARLHWGGLQVRYNVSPDLTTLGKYHGGGMSFGCIGGRRDIMALYDPSNSTAMTHGGTFNNNILSMRAGVVALREVLTPEALNRINALGDDLRNRLNELGQKYNVKLRATGIGSMIAIHWTDSPVQSAVDAAKADDRLKDLHFLEMSLAGIFFSRRGFLALTLAHEQQQVDMFLEKTEEFIKKHEDLLKTKA